MSLTFAFCPDSEVQASIVARILRKGQSLVYRTTKGPQLRIPSGNGQSRKQKHRRQCYRIATIRVMGVRASLNGLHRAAGEAFFEQSVEFESLGASSNGLREFKMFDNSLVGYIVLAQKLSHLLPGR